MSDLKSQNTNQNGAEPGNDEDASAGKAQRAPRSYYDDDATGYEVYETESSEEAADPSEDNAES